MYRSANLSKFEKSNREQAVHRSRERSPIDKQSVAAFQGLAIAAASGGTILLAGAALLTL